MAKHSFPLTWRDNIYFGGTQPDEATNMRLVCWVTSCIYQYSPNDETAVSLVDCLRAIHFLIPKRYRMYAHNYAVCCYYKTTRFESLLVHIDNMELIQNAF